MFNLYLLLFAQGRTFNATAGIAVNGAEWLGPACQSIVVSTAPPRYEIKLDDKPRHYSCH